MKKVIFVIFIFVTSVLSNRFQKSLDHIKPKTSPSVQEKAAFDVISRTIPGQANKFTVKVDPDLGHLGKDTFQVTGENGFIKIKGTTGVAVTTGFHYYLKYYCKAHISWEATQLNLPNPLPNVNVIITLNDRFRYYQNVCTTSYSFVWWDWNQWEKHIDWMALNSFNLVLAFNGQEAIWERVYRKLNLTQSDIDEHFTGPAFLSWLRMGNIRGWGGPLSKAWHERSIFLQKKILKKMRDLGIITVLPAFAGHLPRAFKRIFPNANMIEAERWGSFNDTYCCPYLLDPTEELFKTIGKLFIEEQIAEFGTDHVYNCDTFNEMDPSISDLTYLSNVGKGIYGAMTTADPEAIWIMQGWLFVVSSFWNKLDRVKTLVRSVPRGKMIILDLQSEQYPQYNRLQHYFGQPYIWCMLHNFGGTLGMFGSAKIINENVIKARNEVNSTLIGTGLTAEGINQNYVIYDLMMESAWRIKPVDLDIWFRNYTMRRYGQTNENIIHAWQLLKDSIYNFEGGENIRGGYAITRTPSMGNRIWTWYKYTYLFDAWDQFINASDQLKSSPSFLHDLVDVTRQVLQVNGDIYYQKLIYAYKQKKIEDFQDIAVIFKGILRDLELILSTNTDFLLGPWIASARACGSTPEEKDLYEYNARNQITLWGPFGEIMNYANKQWSGVVSHYFGPRWDIYIDSMNATFEKGTRFNEKQVKKKMFKEVEEAFTFDKTIFPIEPKGDSVEVAKDIHNKWYKLNLAIRKEEPKIRNVRSREERIDRFEKFNPEVIMLI